MSSYFVFGEATRLCLASTAVVRNAHFNVVSGRVTVEDLIFFGQNVSIVTGTHDYTKRGKARMNEVPTSGRDIVIRKGAWIASHVTILGPCIIGENAVVGAGSVVVSDVLPGTVVAGVPAKLIRVIAFDSSDARQGEPKPAVHNKEGI